MIKRILNTYKNAYSNLSKEVCFLSLIVFINRSGSMVLAFMTIYVTTELGFSISEAGLLLSCFGLGAFLGNFFGGKLADKISSIRIQFFSLLCSGVMFFGLEHITSKYILFAYVPILSFCMEMFRPANSVSITHFSKEINRARAFALNRLAINVGMAIGPAVGGFLATKNYGYLFRVDGITCLVAASCVFIFFKSKDVIPAKKSNTEIIKKPSQDTYFLFFLMFALLNAICFMQVFSTFPLFLKLEGYKENIIGLVFTVNAIIIVLFEMVIVHRFEKKNVLKIIAIGVWLTGLGLFLTSYAKIKMLLFIGLIIWTIGEILSIPFMSTHVSLQSNERNRGVYMGYFGATFASAHIIAPSFGSYVLDHYGSTSLWTAVAILSLISGLGMIYLKPRCYTTETA